MQLTEYLVSYTYWFSKNTLQKQISAFHWIQWKKSQFLSARMLTRWDRAFPAKCSDVFIGNYPELLNTLYPLLERLSAVLISLFIPLFILYILVKKIGKSSINVSWNMRISDHSKWKENTLCFIEPCYKNVVGGKGQLEIIWEPPRMNLKQSSWEIQEQHKSIESTLSSHDSVALL